MGIEASIKTALASVAGGRVYPDTTPDNVTFPCVVYQQVGGDVIAPIEGSAPDKENARIQFWVHAKTRLEASDVMRQVKAALVANLNAYPFSAPVSTYDEVMKLRGSRCDFGFWFTP